MNKPINVMELGFTLESPGYIALAAMYKQRHDAFVKHLTTDASARRKTELPDDYLRGYIAALEWVLTKPHTIVARAADQQEERILEEARERQADARARLGPSFPVAP